MEAATGVWGDYILPANGFTAPEGKQLKAWSVNGTEKAARDKIAVAADTTVKAVWENIPAAPTEYNILDAALYETVVASQLKALDHNLFTMTIVE